MTTYKILFVDEEKETLEDFEQYVEGSSSKVKIETLTQLPLPDLNEMVEYIIKLAPDALITDFRLNEMKNDIQYNVPYNGVEIVEEFQSIRYNFPCFVLTALDDEAVNKSKDVNIVYVKNILYKKEEGNAKAKFLDRVVSQIEHYKSSILTAEQDLLKLIELRNSGKANIKDEEKIIDLDQFLEKSIDNRSSIPKKYKTLSNDERLEKLIKKVDELLKKVDDGK